MGGLENGLVNLINRIPADRYRQAVVCLEDFTSFSERIRSPNVEIVALHKKDGKDLGVYIRLWRTLRRLHPAIVHTRNLGTIDMVFPAMLAGVRRRVHGEHGWDMVDLHGKSRKYRQLRRICVPFIKRFITVSEDLGEWLTDQVGAPSAKVETICNGVDTERFNPEGAEVVRMPDAPADALVIGTIGRAVPVKDQLTLVDAFGRLVAQYPDQRHLLRLVLVGDGPELATLRARVAELNLGDLAWLPGRLDGVERVLRGFDIFVLTSLNEGISNTILEAMATGLPIVATAVGGNPELVDDGDTGFLVPVSDAEALSRVLGRYLAEPELRRQQGRQARDKAERHYSLNVMVDRYVSVYDKLMHA